MVSKQIKKQLFVLFFACAAGGVIESAFAQDAVSPAPVTAQQNSGSNPADNSQSPSSGTASAPIARVKNPVAVFSGLDKITGRTTSFRIRINETYQFGSLQITPRVCYTNPPNEPVKTDGFIEVNEITLDQKIKRIFTGWMFADSPGLNAVDHPIYDVWLTNCTQK